MKMKVFRKRLLKSVMALMMAAVMVLTGGCLSIPGIGSSGSLRSISDDPFDKDVYDKGDDGIRDVPVSSSRSQYNTAYQMTEADIQAMNDGNAIIVRSNNGYVSTIIGRFSDERLEITHDIQTFEDGIVILNSLATLLGFTRGTEFFADYGTTDPMGYTILTYKQRYGEEQIYNATLHLIIDPDGYTAGVTCSFQPEIGLPEEEDEGNIISQAQAESIAEQYADGRHLYSEYTQLIHLRFNTEFVHAYFIVTDTCAENLSGFDDLPYTIHYVGTDGTYYGSLNSGSTVPGMDSDYYPTRSYFDGMEQTTWTGTVSLGNVGQATITIPVAYNPSNGLYYMMDLERYIAVADYSDYAFSNTLTFLTSTNNSWEERDIVAYYNYQRAWDAYANDNICCGPGGGYEPMLLLRHWCTQDGTPVNNAVFICQDQGWYIYGYSVANNFCYDLDVIGHEYTHSVTQTNLEGSKYMNETGALNEAFSDIMGNLIEMMAGATTNTDWALSENSNEQVRSMSNPHAFNQPASIGDLFYTPDTRFPSSNNDSGGVHRNSGILNYAAYQLCQRGISQEDAFLMWYRTLQTLTPASNFTDVYAGLMFSAGTMGLGDYTDDITEIFTSNGVLGYDRTDLARNRTMSGCGRITMQLPDGIESSNASVVISLYDAMSLMLGMSTAPTYSCWADSEGVISFLVDSQNSYCIRVSYINSSTNSYEAAWLSDMGWVSSIDYAGGYFVNEGETAVLQSPFSTSSQSYYGMTAADEYVQLGS